MKTPRFLSIMDGYKLIHPRFYKPGTNRVLSNWTPRGSRIPDITEAVLFGLQYGLIELDEIANVFFNTPKTEVLNHFVRRNAAYVGPDNTVGTDHVEALHDLGYLPLLFRALPEGTRSPLRVPQFTVENTVDHAYWLPNHIETYMSSAIWLPITTATSAARMRIMLDRWCAETGGDPGFVQFQAHDFSMRGMQGHEPGAKSGAAHLLSFRGTDTLSAIDFVDDYYPDHFGTPNGWVAGSVPASEHATQCSWGKDGEIDAYRYALRQIPTGPVSIVSDTYDLWYVCTVIVLALKDEIMARDGKVVIRPDSGFPEDILLGARGDGGRPAAAPGSPAWKGVLELLGEVFGTTDVVVDGRTFRMLDPHIGAIYGDSITYDRANAILERQARQGWVSTTEVFGIGSFSYSYVTRDTLGQAQKVTWAEIDGEPVDMFKDPVTDDGTKKSAKGRIAVLGGVRGGGMTLVDQATPEQEAQSLLTPVWENGKFLRTQSFADVRRTLWAGTNVWDDGA